MSIPPRRRAVAIVAGLTFVIMACVVQGPGEGERHRWWAGLGPVLPHDSFPADCSLCHVGQEWNTLNPEFEFDHEAETGYALVGAHQRAQCLRCHNDRGPVAMFAKQGCVGCHEDFHYGELSQDCTNCHNQRTWWPQAQVEKHNRTRFPLTGAHVAVACHRCHPGAFVGNFLPTDTDCITCHNRDLQVAVNPPHIALGWVDGCDNCHPTTDWSHGKFR